MRRSPVPSGEGSRPSSLGAERRLRGEVASRALSLARAALEGRARAQERHRPLPHAATNGPQQMGYGPLSLLE
eukprot:3759027-Alexandrium_andersonii.AAC.1